MRYRLALFLVAALWATAGANGRPAGTSTIHFRQGHESDVVAGMTFGLLISHDSGATWHWMCEKAVGYGGMYDPSYSYSQTGAIFATTFDGLKVMRPAPAGDGCTFASTQPGMTFVSQDQLGPDHAFYYTAADSTNSNVCRSTDDGMTFPQCAMPGMNNDWWSTLIVAPQNAQHVYLSGYRLNAGNKTFLLFQSVNGGQSFTALPTTGLTTSNNSTVEFVGVSPTDENRLYARVTLENAVRGDGIYTIDAQAPTSWTHLLSINDSIAFVVRANGDLVAATQTQGGQKSSNGGQSWTPLANPPHINCLVENSAGEVWACTQNYSSPGVPSDGYGIMKSTDLATWTGVLKFQDIAGPVSCPAGTAQQDMCVGTPSTGVWCMLRQQLGITSTAVACPAAGGADGPPDAGIVKKPGSTGCCDASGGAGSCVLAGIFLAGWFLPHCRRRRT